MTVLSNAPQLKYLSLQWDAAFTTELFFDILSRCNRLHSLSFNMPWTDIPWTDTEISDFPKDCLAQLETLEILELQSLNFLLYCVTATSHLKSLSVSIPQNAAPYTNGVFDSINSLKLSKALDQVETFTVKNLNSENQKSHILNLLGLMDNLKAFILELDPQTKYNPQTHAIPEKLEYFKLTGHLDKEALKIVLKKIEEAKHLKILDISETTVDVGSLNLDKFPHLKDIIILYPVRAPKPKSEPDSISLQKSDPKKQDKNQQNKKTQSKTKKYDNDSEAIGSTVDDDTDFKSKVSYNLQACFFSMGDMEVPPPHLYRIKLKNTLCLENNKEHPFRLRNNKKRNLVKPPYPITFSAIDTCHLNRPFHYYYKKEKHLTHKWQSLESLSPQEIITDMHIAGIDSQDVQVLYCERDNLYRIRHTKGQPSTPIPVTIDFRLQAFDALDKSGKACSPPMYKIIQKYQNYKIKTADSQVPVLDPDATSAQRLQILQTHDVGACRHRSVAGMAETQSTFSDTQVRANLNGAHMYLEIKEPGNKAWIACNLGGYPGDVNIDNSNAPKTAPISLLKALVQIFSYCKQLLKKLFARFIFTHTQDPEPIPTPAIDSAIKSPTEPKIKQYFTPSEIENSQFNTWEITPEPIDTLTNYIHNILQGQYSHYTTLVQLQSSEIVQDFGLLLKKYGIDNNQSIYYASSTKALQITNHNTATMSTGSRGPLFDFLKQNENNTEHQPAMLLIDLDKIPMEDINKITSTLLAKPRTIHGVPIPSCVHIIGLTTLERPGLSIHSDFDRVTLCPFNTEIIQEQTQAITNITREKTETDTHSVMIDLYESPQWDTLLNGQWTLDGTQFVFIEGKLKTALAQAKTHNLPLEIKNKPHDPACMLFLQNAVLDKLIEAPIITSTGYDWERYRQSVQWFFTNTIPTHDYILNPTHFGSYFQTYIFKKRAQQLYTRAGWLEQNKNKTLALYLTRNLSKQQWAQLLEEAQKQEILLHIHVAPQVELPENLAPKSAQSHIPEISSFSLNEFHETELENETDTIESPSEHESEYEDDEGDEGDVCAYESENESQETIITEHFGMTVEHPVVFASTDIDYAIDTLKKKHIQSNNKNPIRNWNISEKEASELLVLLQVHWHEKGSNTEFHFSQQLNALLQALKKGETVILSGHIKPTLIDVLASLCLPEPYIWINGYKNTKFVYKGTLMVVIDPKQIADFSFTQCIKVPVPKAYRSPHSFVHTQSIERYLQYYPNHNPSNNWQGIEEIEHTVTPYIKSKLDLSLATCQAFETQRYNDFMTALQRPHMIIMGKTGVGKTAFMKELAKDKTKYKIYFGKKAGKAWANNEDNPDDNPNQIKIWFRDEANLEGSDFSECESIYSNDKPCIVLNGTHYELSDNQKMVCAANPTGYGSGRITPAFFKRHGGAIRFPVLSPAYLYHRVLSPVFTDSNFTKDKQQSISTDILSIYEYICALSADNVLISPRELQMMAIMTIIHPEHQIYYMHSIAQQCIPEQHKEAFNQWYKESYGEFSLPLETQTHPLSQTLLTQFVLTPSRMSAYQLILDLLELRRFRQTTTNPIAQYAGLGGIAFEGESGTGKTALIQFIIDILESQGFAESSVFDATQHTDKYYIIHPNSDITKKEAIRLKAFQTGSFLFEDDINTGSLKEESSNAFLMGYDLQNNPPNKAGFIRIVTQKPIYTENTVATSVASERRQIKSALALYTTQEMESILAKKGLTQQEACEAVAEYNAVRNYGMQHNKKPLPNFKTLYNKKAKPIIHNTINTPSTDKQAAPILPIYQSPFLAHRHIFKQASHYTKNKYASACIKNNKIKIPIKNKKTAYTIVNQDDGNSIQYQSIMPSTTSVQVKNNLLQTICDDAIFCAQPNDVFHIDNTLPKSQQQHLVQCLQVSIKKWNKANHNITIITPASYRKKKAVRA